LKKNNLLVEVAHDGKMAIDMVQSHHEKYSLILMASNPLQKVEV